MREKIELPLGEHLTRWTVRLAVALYLVRVAVDLRGHTPNRRGLREKARWIWTGGCVLYLLHVIFAFGFYHQWSHHAAYEHTALQTFQVVGINWGGGLYVNYVFTVFWLLDVAMWWFRGAAFPYRSISYLSVVHAVFGFMVINATIVFGPPIWRQLAPAIGILLVIALVTRNRQAERSPPFQSR